MIQKRSNCPISCSLEVFGDKWSLLIIRDLMFREKASFGELLASEEKIATNILADRLQLLEKEGILTKAVSSQNKSKFIYRLTSKGIDLLPLMLELMQWGAKYNPDCPRKEVGSRLPKEKAAVIREYMHKLMDSGSSST